MLRQKAPLIYKFYAALSLSDDGFHHLTKSSPQLVIAGARCTIRAAVEIPRSFDLHQLLYF